MLPHRIRLRGPWNVQLSTGATRGLRLPGDWPVAVRPDESDVRFERRFGWTAALADHERLWLVVDGLAENGRVAVNGRELGSAVERGPSWPLPHGLQDRNELTIAFASPSPGVALWEEAAIEVRARVWLDDLRAWRCGDVLTVHLRAVGDIDVPLDVYGVMGRRPILHAMLRDGPGKFEFTAEVEPEVWLEQVRIELMCGGVVWHVANVLIPGS